MRRSSLLFILFIATILLATALFPILWGERREKYYEDHYDEYEYGQQLDTVLLSSSDVSTISSSLTDLSVNIWVDSTISVPSVYYTPESYSFDFDETTATLTIKGAETDSMSKMKKVCYITLPTSAHLASIVCPGADRIDISGLECQSLVIAPLAQNLYIRDCMIGSLSIGPLAEFWEQCSISIESSDIRSIVSETPTDMISLQITHSAIGSLQAARP